MTRVGRNALDALVGILGLTGPGEAEDALRQLDRAGWELTDRLTEIREATA